MVSDLGFQFFHPIEVRYRDVDAQRHVNSATYFTYMEQARAKYLQALGLWSGEDFDAIGIILAEQSCTYRKAFRYGQVVEVGVRVSRLGRKSFEVSYSLREQASGEEYARGRTVLVAYDYRRGQSVPIPEAWRQILARHEGLVPGDPANRKEAGDDED